MQNNIFFQQTTIGLAERSAIKNHRPAVIWFTGLSGSGKSTIANQLELVLNHTYRAHTYILDGDNTRLGLNKDLGFSVSDRKENIRRITEVARLFHDAGLIVITAFISPFQIEREFARSLIGADFLEVFIDCPLDVCARRDPKGLYAKANEGKLADFTGIDSPYEVPTSSEIHIKTDRISIESASQMIIDVLINKKIIGNLNG